MPIWHCSKNAHAMTKLAVCLMLDLTFKLARETDTRVQGSPELSDHQPLLLRHILLWCISGKEGTASWIACSAPWRDRSLRYILGIGMRRLCQCPRGISDAFPPLWAYCKPAGGIAYLVIMQVSMPITRSELCCLLITKGRSVIAAGYG